MIHFKSSILDAFKFRQNFLKISLGYRFLWRILYDSLYRMIAIHWIQRILLITLFFSSNASAHLFKGSIHVIPKEIKNRILEKLLNQNTVTCPVSIERLKYITVSYYGFDGMIHEGHLVVSHLVAKDIIQIFRGLFHLKYPIEKMNLPDNYPSGVTDEVLMQDNNTSAFFCREDGQNPGKPSPHSWGIAIDINPLYNPALIDGGEVSPRKGKKYFQDRKSHPAIISQVRNKEVVELFARHGWKWGGFFEPNKLDYMHFQKEIDQHYSTPTLILHSW